MRVPERFPGTPSTASTPSVPRRGRQLLAGLTAATLVLGTVAAAPTVAASAAPTRTHAVDPHDARYEMDTRAVYLYQDFHSAIVVQTVGPHFRNGPHFNGLDVYLDTRGTGANDYRVAWAFGRDGDGYTQFDLLRVNGTDVVGRVSCPGLHGAGRKHGVLEVSVPRSCVSVTKTVRTYTLAWDFTRYRDGRPVRGASDRAPQHGYLN